MLVYQRVSEVHRGISSATQYYTPGYDMIYEYMWCMMWIWRWIADDIQGKKHHDLFLPRTHDNHGEIMVKIPTFLLHGRGAVEPQRRLSTKRLCLGGTFFKAREMFRKNLGTYCMLDIYWTHIYIYIYIMYMYLHIYIYTYTYIYIHDLWCICICICV